MSESWISEDNMFPLEKKTPQKYTKLGLSNALKVALFERARRDGAKLVKHVEVEARKVIEQYRLTDEEISRIYTIFTTKQETDELYDIFGGI